MGSPWCFREGRVALSEVFGVREGEKYYPKEIQKLLLEEGSLDTGRLACSS